MTEVQNLIPHGVCRLLSAVAGSPEEGSAVKEASRVDASVG